MPIIIKSKKSDYMPAPEGLELAVCCDAIDLGVQDTGFGRKRQVELRWQTNELMPARDESGPRPYLVLKRYGASMHKKSNLRRDLESWRGRAMTEEEVKEFDVEKLIGACCQLNIQHVPFKDGSGVFAKVSAIVPAPKGMPPIKIRGYQRICERPGYKPPDPNELEGDILDEHGEIPAEVAPTSIYDDDVPF